MNRRNFLKNLAKAAGAAACVPLAVESFRSESPTILNSGVGYKKMWDNAVNHPGSDYDYHSMFAKARRKGKSWYPWYEHSEKEVKERFEAEYRRLYPMTPSQAFPPTKAEQWPIGKLKEQKLINAGHILRKPYNITVE